MSDILTLDKSHIKIIADDNAFHKVFIPSVYGTYGAARKEMKRLMNDAGYENLSLEEKHAVGRWNLISNQSEIDSLFGDIEKADILKFHESQKSTIQTGRTKSISNKSYRRVDRMIYKGNIRNEILVINVDVKVSKSGTVYSARVYDKTHGKVVAEVTGQTNTNDMLVNLGEILYQPEGESILEIQVKRESGTGKVMYDSLAMEVM